MLKAELIEKHTKDSWSVSVFEDGTILVESLFVHKPNISHVFTEGFDWAIFNLPAYVNQMVWEAIQLYYDTVS